MQRGMSGSANTAPLGSVRRPLGGGGALGGSLLNPSYMAPKGGDDSGKIMFFLLYINLFYLISNLFLVT